MPTSAPALRAAALWPVARQRALKRKTLTHAEAAEALGIPGDEVPVVLHALHVYCWARGLPPLNVVVVRRGKTADADGGFASSDYDVLHECLGYSLYTLEQAWHYPWAKVPDPTPEQVEWALRAHAGQREAITAFRYLDVEAELRHRDEARGRRRPSPPPHTTWGAAEAELAAVVARLAAGGLAARDLRPPGNGPYPPARPIRGNWAD